MSEYNYKPMEDNLDARIVVLHSHDNICLFDLLSKKTKMIPYENYGAVKQTAISYFDNVICIKKYSVRPRNPSIPLITDTGVTTIIRFFEPDELSEIEKCVCCRSERKVLKAIAPCGHSNLCDRCLKSTACPICKIPISCVIELK